MKKDKIKNITYIALFVSAMAVISQIAIPIGAVPITVQTFVIALTGYFLGAKTGTLAVFVYIALGCVGAPVFANFQGGFHMIIGYTGGFIIGFLPFAILCGIGKKPALQISFGFLGLVVCHIFGVLQYMLVSGVSLFTSFLAVSLPFLIKDILLTLCAYFLSKTLKTRLKI